MSSKALVFFALLALAASEQTNPIQKVIEMISNLEAKILKEGEAEDKAFKEFFSWCDDAAKNKQFEIKTATAEKEKLEATIAKAKSDAEDAVEAIANLVGEIATDQKDLEDATLIREKEHADFLAAEAELVDGIDVLTRAAGIIEREMKGGALLQTQVDTSNVDILVKTLSTLLEAASFPGHDQQTLLALVQNKQADADDDSELGAPDPAVYKSQSGGIVDVLNDMKEKAEGELSALRKAEMNTQHNYDMLKQSLTDEIAAAEHNKAEQEAVKNEADQTKAAAEGDLEVTNKDLATAQEALAVINTDCMTTAQDHERSVTGRAEELKALATAKKIIQESAGGAEGQTYSFLQIGSASKAGSQLRTSVDLKNFEVVNAVKRLAAQHNSPELLELASRMAAAIRYGSAGGDDPFAKVKGLINDMIAKLMKEAAEEASHKEYCDEEMSKTKAKKDELTADIEKLTSKIDQASARSADLKAQVKELQKELADLADSQAEMDKIRADQKATFEKAQADLQQGLEGIRGALKVLRDYYQADEAALLQDDAFMQQPAPPKPATHSAASGAGGGIISMLEVIESDFAKNLAEIEAEESTAQSDYDTMTQENKVTKTTKEQDVKYKTKEFTTLDKNVAELTGDRDGTQTELDAVLEYYEKIKDECIAKPETYEERKRRREAEIAGLKEALSILEGEAAFLQKRSITRHA